VSVPVQGDIKVRYLKGEGPDGQIMTGGKLIGDLYGQYAQQTTCHQQAGQYGKVRYLQCDFSLNVQLVQYVFYQAVA